MSLADLFQSLGATPIGAAERGSTLLFALTESVHVIGLTLLGGAVIAASLSAAGLLWPATPKAVVWRNLRPALFTGLGVTILSGVLLVSAGALKYYTNPIFFWKLGLVVFATALTVAVSRRVARLEPSAALALPWRIAAGATLLAWLSVILAGRAIGLV